MDRRQYTAEEALRMVFDSDFSSDGDLSRDSGSEVTDQKGGWEFFFILMSKIFQVNVLL